MKKNKYSEKYYFSLFFDFQIELINYYKIILLE